MTVDFGVRYTVAAGTASQGESRQQILGAAKAGKTHSWQGVWVSGRLAVSSGSTAAWNEPAPIPLPFGRDVTTARASRLPEKHRSLRC